MPAYDDVIQAACGVTDLQTAEWQTLLEKANIPVMVVNTPAMLMDDPQLAASGFWRFVEHPTEGRLRMTDPPISFSKTPSSIRLMPPQLGAHSIDILHEAGYSSDEIQAMIAAGITGECPDE